MPATTAYQAGVEANATQISYGIETVWGTAPAASFQAIRYTGETLTGAKQRVRPQEINLTRDMSAAVTAQESASGAINYALSYGTFDDFMSVLLGTDWQAPQAIAGAAADITLTTGTNILSSGTANKFQNLNANTFIRLLGFANASNNGIFFVSAKTNNQSITLNNLGGAAFVTETPILAQAQVRASNLRQGTQFKSLFIQQMLSSNKYFQYPGSYITGMTLTGGVGQFLSGSFNIASQVEQSATADASTGGVLPAPTGRVHDAIGTFGGVYVGNAPIAATVDSFTLNINNTGAAAEYGVGSAKAAGMLAGSIEVTGKIKMFFKDFTYYSLFKGETLNQLSFITKDPAGNAYVITLWQAAFMSTGTHATAPNGAVYAEFDIEGNPGGSGLGTITIDRLPAT